MFYFHFFIRLELSYSPGLSHSQTKKEKNYLNITEVWCVLYRVESTFWLILERTWCFLKAQHHRKVIKNPVEQLFNRTSLCTTEGKAEQGRCTTTISVLSILSQFLTTIQCKVVTLLVFRKHFFGQLYSEMKIWSTFLGKNIYSYGNLQFSTHSFAVIENRKLKTPVSDSNGLKLLFCNDAYVL